MDTANQDEGAELILHNQHTPGAIFRRFLRTAKAVAPAGAGFLADAYDIFAINLVLTVLGTINPIDKTWDAIILGATSFGTIIGQLGFGALADKVGRKIIFMSTAIIISVTTLIQTLTPPLNLGDENNDNSNSSLSSGSTETQVGTFVFLAVFRCLLGIGIGGEYPLSSTTTSESATNVNTRGRRIAAVFSMQGIGAFLATLVGFSLLAAEVKPNLTFRILIGVGVLPSILAFLLRLSHFREDKTEKVLNFEPFHFKDITWPHWKLLIGTAMNWFLLDIVFYGNALFSSRLIAGWLGDERLDSSSGEQDKDLAQAALYTFLLTCSALPGYWFAIYAIDSPWFGRWRLQFWGFVALAVVYSLIAILYKKLLNGQFALPFVLYALTYFFINAGPNTTTYVLPAEVFPARLRATFHGISAASGKAGALLGTFGIAQLKDYPQWVFGSCAAICALGCVFTFFFTVETRGMALDSGIPQRPRGFHSPKQPVQQTEPQ